MQTMRILVTGASGGIGRAVCHRLAGQGHSLVLAARDAGNLQALMETLPSSKGPAHLVLPVDMTNDESIMQFSRTLTDNAVVLDGLVLMPPQPAPTNDPFPGSEAWRALFQGSFVGPLALLKAAISTMAPDPAQGRRAKIVIISGISSAQVLGHYATSNVVRLAWLAQAKTLAFALGERGIHINTLSLGGTLTPKYKATVEKRAADAGMPLDARIAQETDNVPLHKYGTPEETAVAIEGLLSPFTDHITGVNLLHDGGFTRAY